MEKMEIHNCIPYINFTLFILVDYERYQMLRKNRLKSDVDTFSYSMTGNIGSHNNNEDIKIIGDC